MTIEYPATIEAANGKLSGDCLVAMLTAAICANLEARLAHDRRRERAARGKPFDLKLTSAGDVLGADKDWLYLDPIIRDPVRKALRAQLHELGQRLYRALGTTTGMLEVAEAAACHTKRPGLAMAIIDKAWDMVGEGTDRWVA